MNNIDDITSDAPKVTRRALLGGAASLLGTFSLISCSTTSSKFLTAPKNLDAIYPGEVWHDTDGKPIQAHAGSLIAVDDTFYWYGENKEYTDGKSGIESWGIRFYRSKDLYNWEDLGAIIPANIEDPESPLSYKVYPERPHIIYNPVTKKYVCWIKIRGLGPQFRTVLVADDITGPYMMVHEKLFPAGLHAGDFDFVVDENTNKAYMYFEHDHSEIICAELTEDWTDVTENISHHFPRKPPNTREAPALFKHDNTIYMTTSGLSGYFPNPSEIASAQDYHGPFKTLGILHPNDVTETSFNSQISDVFKVPGKKNLYIALADTWFPHVADDPNYASGDLSRWVRSAIAKATSKPRKPFTPEEQQAVMYAAQLTGVNTSISRYVWLPITFNGDYPTIEWRDSWRIEDFE